MSEPVLEPLTPTVNSKWRCDIDTAYDIETPGTADWDQLRAVQNFTPAVNPEVKDATDYDSRGWGADAVTSRKWQNVIVLGRRTGAAGYPAGQEFLRAAADNGDVVHVRWYEREIPTGEAYEGYALVQWEPQGGPAADLSVVNVTLLGQGARIVIDHPDAPVVP